MSYTGFPTLRLELEGSPIDSVELAACRALQVRQLLNHPAQCVLKFSADMNKSLPTSFNKGKALHIYIVGEAEDTLLFEGDIIGLEYSFADISSLYVIAYDPLYRLQQQQANARAFSGTCRDIAADILKAHGLKLSSSSTAEAVFLHLIHHHASDLLFLQHLCWRNGRFLSFEAGEVHIHSLAGYRDAKELHLPQEIYSLNIIENSLHAVESLSSSTVDIQMLAMSEQEAQSSEASSGKPRHYLHNIGYQAAAQQQLEGWLEYWHNQHYHMEAVTKGDATLRPATPITVSGGDVDNQELQKSYCLSEVVHTINSLEDNDDEGYSCLIKSQAPQPPQIARGTTVALAEVLEVSDPEKQGRIKVVFPSFANSESTWLHVMQLGAGEGKGITVLPLVGDTVLVLLLQHDPSFALVLGSLYKGAQPPSDAGDGMVWYMQGAQGCAIKFSQDGLEISAPQKTINFTAKEINFQEG